MTNEMQMNDADRRANLNLAITVRDELLERAGYAVAGQSSLYEMSELHSEILMFLDGVHCRRHPGVAARLRAGLQAIGWTRAMGEQACRDYAASLQPAMAAGVTEATKCQRCGGAGYLSAYKHVSGGECFDCGGSGLADDVD